MTVFWVSASVLAAMGSALAADSGDWALALFFGMVFLVGLVSYGIEYAAERFL